MNEDVLDALRDKINAVDTKLVALLNERARLAIELGKAKGDSNRPIYNPSRELEILQHVEGLNDGPLPKGSLEDIYASIITACRELQLK